MAPFVDLRATMAATYRVRKRPLTTPSEDRRFEYVRIYSDLDGESHFGEAATPLAAGNFAPPAPPLIISTPIPTDQFVFFILPSGWFGDWHPAPRRQYYIQLSGQFGVEVSDGETRQFNPGDIGLLEDVTGKGHKSWVIGTEDVRGMFVQLPPHAV